MARDGFLRLYYRYSTKLLYIGKRSYQHYRRLRCPDDKLIFSPYCVDIAPFEVDENARTRVRSALRDELGVSEQQVVLLFSGKLSLGNSSGRILYPVSANFPPATLPHIGAAGEMQGLW